MKKLKLKGKQIRLLLKVENAGFGFFPRVSTFLEENAILSDEETTESEFKNDEFDDVTDMITDYLTSNSLNKEDRATEQESSELKELMDQLNPE